MDLDQKRNALRLQLETAINDLKKQAESQGCKIAQRRRVGYLYAVDAARNIVLETWFTKLLSQHGSVIKKHRSSNAIKLADIVEIYGGLNKTIKLIEAVLALRGSRAAYSTKYRLYGSSTVGVKRFTFTHATAPRGSDTLEQCSSVLRFMLASTQPISLLLRKTPSHQVH